MSIFGKFKEKYKEASERVKAESDQGGPTLRLNRPMPYEFGELERKIEELYKGGYDQKIFQFLVAVNTVDPDAKTLEVWIREGLRLKMMYEYRRKHYSLVYGFDARDTLSGAEVLRRFESEERNQFWRFCEEQYKIAYRN